MKLRSPLLISVVAAVGAVVLRIWMSTMRTRAVSVDGRPHPVDPAVAKYIYAFWHDGLLALVTTKSKSRVLISKHVDGELIAQVCGHLGVGVVRGSSSRGGNSYIAQLRGGMAALLEMIHSSGEIEHLAITPDGPRGPRRVLQPGTVMVASQTGSPVVPIGIGFSCAWRAPSWDRFAVPCPFSTMVGVVGEPINVPPSLTKEEMRRYQSLVQARLDEVTSAAEEWAQRICREGSKAAPPAGGELSNLRKAA